MTEISQHPYDAFIPEGADKLIIGTIPPYCFCQKDKETLYSADVDFYYGSKDNYFWKLLSDIFNIRLTYKNTVEAIEERKQLLSDIHSGITDSVGACIHTEKRSDDASLSMIQQKNISDLLLQNPDINELIYTSRFVIRQVNASLAHFCGCGVRHKWQSDSRLDGSVRINGRLYTVHILYSPSPNALRSVISEKRIERYKEVFKSE